MSRRETGTDISNLQKVYFQEIISQIIFCQINYDTFQRYPNLAAFKFQLDMHICVCIYTDTYVYIYIYIWV